MEDGYVLARFMAPGTLLADNGSVRFVCEWVAPECVFDAPPRRVCHPPLAPGDLVEVVDTYVHRGRGWSLAVLMSVDPYTVHYVDARTQARVPRSSIRPVVSRV